MTLHHNKVIKSAIKLIYSKVAISRKEMSAITASLTNTTHTTHGSHKRFQSVISLHRRFPTWHNYELHVTSVVVVYLDFLMFPSGEYGDRTFTCVSCESPNFIIIFLMKKSHFVSQKKGTKH